MKVLAKIGMVSALICCFCMATADEPPASVPSNMYVCSVRNADTGEIFYGKSIKESYAEMYARATCQMKSHSGNCVVRASCEYESRQVPAND